MTNWIYDYDRRTAASYDVGHMWQSPSGQREIVGEQPHPSSGEMVYLVSTNGSRSTELIPKDKIERIIKVETSQYESRNRGQQEAKALQDVETQRLEVKRQHDSWMGFTDNMNPLTRRRAADVLGKFVSFNRQSGERGQLLLDRVRKGWRMVRHPSFGLLFQAPDESFLLEKDLTKIGVAFVEYLVDKHKF